MESAPSYETLTAMISREMIGLLPDDLVSENDFVLTSDADLYPVDLNYYTTFNNYAVHVWNAGCCGSFNFKSEEYEMYPIGKFYLK